MCLPALAVAGTLFSAAGSVAQGRAQAKVYEAQAKIASQNARLAELQGRQELEKGAREEANFRRQARQFQSSQRTRLAASGSQLSGSALSILSDTASGIEQDANVIRFNTLQSKYSRDVQAMNFRNEASVARTKAKNSRDAGKFGGLTTLLGIGNQIAGIKSDVPTGAEINGGSITLASKNKDYYSWHVQTGLYSSGRYGPYKFR